MKQDELIPHLFRNEYRKITAVLFRLFGFDHIEIAEDIASDTFLSAAETWGLKGLPENPAAWLYSVAKNKAKNYLKHQAVHNEKFLRQHSVLREDELPELDLSPENIKDSQLQMIFAVCHPSIPIESQIGLALQILCGFGINEIANAFLTSKETIVKRLHRAREKIRTEKIEIEFPGQHEISSRLETVLTTLYLLFNEGYYSLNNEIKVRQELCGEAMNLTYLLIENESTNIPAVNALLALMCFQASRLDARTDDQGETVLYDDQDANLWNKELIEKGEYFLNNASQGNILTKYHLEAGIASWHTTKEENKWESILQLYNQLLIIEYSPVAALNRTYALYKARGVDEALVEAEKLELHENHFFYTLLGELYSSRDPKRSRECYEKALQLAGSDSDREVIRRKFQQR